MPYAINMNLFVGAKDEALLSNITTVENKKKRKEKKISETVLTFS